jgi:putative transposase
VARPLRVEFAGAWYHVMNRGAARREVFLDQADRREFLGLIADVRSSFAVEIHAYCLMGSHYHLLVRTSRANLGQAMRHLDGVYTQRLNRRRRTDGPLFRGRYRAILIQADRHLTCVSRYIHLNPVEAGLAARPEDWPFSSYSAYLDPWRSPWWLTTEAILLTFGSIGARRHYRCFVEEGLDPGTRDFYGRPRPALGDDEFREEIRRRAALEVSADRERIPDLDRLGHAVPLATIAQAIVEAFDLPPAALPVGAVGRSGKSGLARGAFVRAARQLGGHRLDEIASWLGYATYASVSKAAARFSQAAERDPSLGERFNAAMSNVKT